MRCSNGEWSMPLTCSGLSPLSPVVKACAVPGPCPYTELISKWRTVCWPQSGDNLFHFLEYPSFYPQPVWTQIHCHHIGELSFLSILPVLWVWQLEAQKSNVSPPKAVVHKAGMASNGLERTAKKIEHLVAETALINCAYYRKVRGKMLHQYSSCCSYVNIYSVFPFWNSTQDLPTSTGN